ncbi:GNAT family N-acetyltransferase [Nocardioides sp. AN3]
MAIVPMDPSHWPEVWRIYAAGIATGDATFETEPPSWERFDAGRLPDHRWVAVDAGPTTGPTTGPATVPTTGRVIGWVAASPISDRCAYAGVVEHSVYVDPAARGRGTGRALLDALIASTEAAGIWTIQSGIFPENAASLALHRSAGFRVVGTRERVGRMSLGAYAGRWRDVVLVERRSSVAGVEGPVGTMSR